MEYNIKNISTRGIKIYMDFYQYSGVDAALTELVDSDLKQLFLDVPVTNDENTLKITANQETAELSVQQFYFDLEAFSTVPPEIESRVTWNNFFAFMNRFFERSSKYNWSVFFSGPC